MNLDRARESARLVQELAGRVRRLARRVQSTLHHGMTAPRGDRNRRERIEAMVQLDWAIRNLAAAHAALAEEVRRIEENETMNKRRVELHKKPENPYAGSGSVRSEDLQAEARRRRRAGIGEQIGARKPRRLPRPVRF